MDRIIIKDARFSCNAGITAGERSKKQKIFADIELSCSVKKAAEKDDIKYAINYQEVFNLAKETAESQRYSLIEAIADRIAGAILKNFNVKKVLVRIKKPSPRGIKAAYCAVEISRK